METRLYKEGTVPACTTPEWYRGRERAAHLEDPVHQGRLKKAFEYAVDAALYHGCQSICDVGCGDGGLISLLGDRFPDSCVWGYDLQPTNVKAAQEERGVSVILVDVERVAYRYGALTICTEFLEHLMDPHAFLRRAPNPLVRAIVASSPVNESSESHYAHHTWAWDQEGFRALFEQAGFVVGRHEIVDEMFQVVLAHR